MAFWYIQESRRSKPVWGYSKTFFWRTTIRYSYIISWTCRKASEWQRRQRFSVGKL